jgi:Bacterial Ig-like domain (group 3)/FG-GAP-like repeat/Calx-beta domain
MKIIHLINPLKIAACGLALLFSSGMVAAQTPWLAPQGAFFAVSRDGAGGPLPICNAFLFSDLNGDGRDDLIINQGDRTFPRPANVPFTFQTQLTNADGTQAPPITRDSGIFGCTFTTAKMFPNSNNKSMVVFNASATNGVPTPHGIGILPGNGDGTFGTPVVVNGPVGGALNVMDVSGAGYATELLVNESGTLKIYSRNQPDGSYSPTPMFTLANVSFSTSPVVIDLNGDGRDDLVVVTQDSNGVLSPQTYLGGGTINSPSLTLNNTLSATTKVSADFNGDGKPDFLLSETVAGISTNTIVLNDGTGKPGPTSIVVPAYPNDALFTDMDGDGFADLITDKQSLFTYQLFFQKGVSDGTFQQPVLISEAPRPSNENTKRLLSIITTGPGGKKSIVATQSSPALLRTDFFIFLNQDLVPATTSTELIISPITATAGQALSFTAAVSGDTPTGNVWFFFNQSTSAFASNFGTAPLVNGQASFSRPTGLPVGTYTIAAVYDGNSRNKVSLASKTFTVATATPLPTFTSVSDITVKEGQTATFAVTLSDVTAQAASVQLTLVDGTAKGGLDYSTTMKYSDDNGVTYNPLAPGGIAFIKAGVASFLIQVTTLNDSLNEPDETYNLYVDAVSGISSTVRGWGIGTIQNVNVVVPSSPKITGVSDVAVREGQVATFTVTLNGVTTQSAAVKLSLVDGTAKGGLDYSFMLKYSDDKGLSYKPLASGGTATIQANVSSFMVQVTTLKDFINEPTETYNLYVDPASGISAGRGWGIGRILNN